MSSFRQTSKLRRQGQAVRRLLLAFALLLGQLHALEHAVAHELSKERLAHACLLCAAADELGSGLPALAPPVAPPAVQCAATVAAPSHCARLIVHPYRARAPPCSSLS